MYDKPEFPESWTLNHLFDAAHEVLTTSWDGRAGAIAGEHDGVNVTVAVRKTKKGTYRVASVFPTTRQTGFMEELRCNHRELGMLARDIFDFWRDVHDESDEDMLSFEASASKAIGVDPSFVLEQCLDFLQMDSLYLPDDLATRFFDCVTIDLRELEDTYEDFYQYQRSKAERD